MASGLILTLSGAALIEEAVRRGEAVVVTSAVFGDGGGAPVVAGPDVKSLVSQFGKAAFTQGQSGPGMITGQVVINARQHPGKVLREFGLTDRDGVLIAYGAYPDTWLPGQDEAIVKEIVVNFVMSLAQADSVVLETDPTVSLLTQEMAASRFLFRKGDTATGDIGAPMFQGNGAKGVPEGAGPLAAQLNSRAVFYQPNFETLVAGADIYVPLTKGRSARKDKQGGTVVSYGYLLTEEAECASPAIHGAGDDGESCAWVFDIHTGRIRSKAGTFALEDASVPVGVPFPWPGDTPPPGFAFMQGQSFDTVACPRTAQAYPSGVLPVMAGRTIIGKTDDRDALSTADGEVKTHLHTGAVLSRYQGTRKTSSSGGHRHRGGMGGPGTVYSTVGTGSDNTRQYNLNYTSTDGDHVHSVDLGSHDHEMRIDAFGATKNTVDNIAFNYIVRLA